MKEKECHTYTFKGRLGLLFLCSDYFYTLLIFKLFMGESLYQWVNNFHALFTI